jgi:hypothetical protein
MFLVLSLTCSLTSEKKAMLSVDSGNSVREEHLVEALPRCVLSDAWAVKTVWNTNYFLLLAIDG